MSNARIKPSTFRRCQPSAGLFVPQHRQPKPERVITNLAAMDEAHHLGKCCRRGGCDLFMG
ncbi:MAG: hypothetical protein QM617_12125 [Comamonas sp.]